MLLENKGERTKTSKSFHDSFNGSMEERVFVYAASLVGRKEGRKEGNCYRVEKEF